MSINPRNHDDSRVGKELFPYLILSSNVEKTTDAMPHMETCKNTAAFSSNFEIHGWGCFCGYTKISYKFQILLSFDHQIINAKG